MMLTESLIGATEGETAANLKTRATIKNDGIVVHQVQPEATVSQVLKTVSTPIHGLAATSTHILAVQSASPSVKVYERGKGNQVARAFFPSRVTSIAIRDESTVDIAVLGLADGRLVIWEVLTGRASDTQSFHTEPVSVVKIHAKSNTIVTGSDDTNLQVWDLVKTITFADNDLDDRKFKAPLRAFTQHRAGIKDIVFSHGSAFTVTAISVGENGVIHVWNPSTSEVIHTIQVTCGPRCLALDPVDRALYMGCNDGTVNCIDLFATFKKLPNSQDEKATTISIVDSVAHKFGDPPSTNGSIGTTNCIAVSYDGTTIYTGHASGKIFAWDTAKKSPKSLVTWLDHIPTNIVMLPPTGLPEAISSFGTPVIVKPKPAETFSTNDVGTSGIPANYSIQIQMTGLRPRSVTDSSMPSREYETRIRNPSFFNPGPFAQELIDEGLDELSQSVNSDLVGETESTEEDVTADAPAQVSSGMNDISQAPDPIAAARERVLINSALALQRERDEARETRKRIEAMYDEMIMKRS